MGNMKKVMENIWDFLCALGEAKYAADLARNGKIEEAKQVYSRVS
jgi:hypothetical protein